MRLDTRNSNPSHVVDEFHLSYFYMPSSPRRQPPKLSRSPAAARRAKVARDVCTKLKEFDEALL